MAKQDSSELFRSSTKRALHSSSLECGLKGKGPGVVPVSLNVSTDPIGLSSPREITYAQRYSLGVPRILSLGPANTDRNHQLLQKSTQSMQQQEYKGMNLPSGSALDEPLITSKQAESKSSNLHLPATAARNALPAQGTQLKSGDEALSRAVRSFLRSNTSTSGLNPVKPPLEQAKPHRLTPPGSAPVVILPTEVQRVIIAESGAEPLSVSPALARQVSLNRNKSIEGRQPSPLRRLTTSSSSGFSSVSMNINSTAQKLTSEAEGIIGSGVTVMKAAQSMPLKLLLPVLPPAAGPVVPPQPETLALTARSHSTPDVTVVAFESRTERLLNQHRRLEEHAQLEASGSTSGAASPERTSGRLSATIKARVPSSPTLNPIPSRKAVDFSETSPRKRTGRRHARNLDLEQTTLGRNKKPGFLGRLVNCFSGSGTFDTDIQAVQADGRRQEKAHGGFQTARSSGQNPDPAASPSSEAMLPLTSADLLRKSITLLSNTGSPRVSPLIAGISDRLLVSEPAVMVMQSAVVLMAPASDRVNEEPGGTSDRPELRQQPPEVQGFVSMAGEAKTVAQAAASAHAETKEVPADSLSQAKKAAGEPRRYGAMHKEHPGRAMRKAVSTNHVTSPQHTGVSLQASAEKDSSGSPQGVSSALRNQSAPGKYLEEMQKAYSAELDLDREPLPASQAKFNDAKTFQPSKPGSQAAPLGSQEQPADTQRKQEGQLILSEATKDKNKVTGSIEELERQETGTNDCTQEASVITDPQRSAGLPEAPTQQLSGAVPTAEEILEQELEALSLQPTAKSKALEKAQRKRRTESLSKSTPSERGKAKRTFASSGDFGSTGSISHSASMQSSWATQSPSSFCPQTSRGFKGRTTKVKSSKQLAREKQMLANRKPLYQPPKQGQASEDKERTRTKSHNTYPVKPTPQARQPFKLSSFSVPDILDGRSLGWEKPDSYQQASDEKKMQLLQEAMSASKQQLRGRNKDSMRSRNQSWKQGNPPSIRLQAWLPRHARRPHSGETQHRLRPPLH